MQLLDSQASRMSPKQVLLTLHADYIGGEHANYCKWVGVKRRRCALYQSACASFSSVQTTITGRLIVNSEWSLCPKVCTCGPSSNPYTGSSENRDTKFPMGSSYGERDQEDIIGYDDVNQLFW